MAGFGCGDASSTNGVEREAVIVEPTAKLVFPDALRVSEPSVNEFISRAMTVCVARRYDDFRLLWSVRDEPLSREEFEHGWHAVRRITVLAVEEVRLREQTDAPPADDPKAYLVFAEVELDPSHPAARKESARDAILLLVREDHQWRLAHSPKPLREWIKAKLGRTSRPKNPDVSPTDETTSASRSSF